MDSQQNEKILREAVLLAEAWQNRANELLRSDEKVLQDHLMRLMSNPIDKVILT